MGEHIDNRASGGFKRSKKRTSEAVDTAAGRKRRVSFKNYLHELEEELIAQELEYVEPEPEEKEESSGSS